MASLNRATPQPGEFWICVTGEKYEILEIQTNPDTGEQLVVCRQTKHPETLSKFPMREFMATLGEGNNTLTCYFQKVEGFR